MREDFDKAYYDRYYRNLNTRVGPPAESKRQAAFIAHYLRYLEVPVRRILDLGCGLGRVLGALAEEYPRAHIQGVEVSDYLCKRYGWVQSSVVDYTSKQPYDLVLCNDVLAYLDDVECTQALKNIAALSRSAVFLGILTEEDWALCDTERTDPNQHLRPKAWYQRRLRRELVNVGGGLYLKKPLEYPVWTLDRLT